MANDVKMGVIGCGSIAEIAHFPSIDRQPGAVLHAVCDIDAATAENAAKKWGAEYWFTDYREMFEKCKLDGVVIATPNDGHRNQAVCAANHGVHVVVEKPMTVTNFEAWEVVEACKRNKVKLMVGCDRRFWTHNQWAKQLIEDGVVGKILMSRACLHEHWYNYQNHVARTPWRTDITIAGGAALNDTGAHAIDLLTWLNGVKVSRVVGVAKRMAMPEDYTHTDDTALLMMEYENGAMGTVSCNRFSHAVNQVTELCGTEGTIFTSTDAVNPYQSWPMAVYTNREYSVDEVPQIIKDFRWPQLFWVEDIIHGTVQKRWVPMCPSRTPNNYERMTAHYLDCIVNDIEPLVSGEDGARSIQVMCAVLKSMKTGSWVDVSKPLDEEIMVDEYTPVAREGK
jgi:predicted dehydrogenase